MERAESCIQQDSVGSSSSSITSRVTVRQPGQFIQRCGPLRGAAGVVQLRFCVRACERSPMRVPPLIPR